jgi:two-component system, cell cycle sensor histidine kinase and response regulator CckA
LERTQSQLLQAQKLEALGRLAGGIAHDFNNLLTLIVGAADLLRPALEHQHEAREDLELIVDATKRATGITRRLLAFGRQQEQRQESVDLNALAMDASRMLRRLIGDDVTLKLDLDAGIPHVFADPVHLEQIVMNLVINARDAMQAGGNVTLQTRRACRGELPEALPSAADMITLRVIDDGIGMDEAVRKQLFEPFFTTKPVGKGTGLGLSTVYGLVNQNRGHISVQSSPGQGATFTVFLPIADAARKLEQAVPTRVLGSILVVEDEDGIRRLASRTLRKAGFEVHEAREGVDALVVEGRMSRVDLVVTDVVMPGMGGPELVKRLRQARPTLPVVFMSGHTFDVLDASSLHPRLDLFLAKPFTPQQLQLAVEKLLARAASGAEQVSA